MIDYAEQLRTHCARFDIAYYAEWGAVLRGWAAGGRDGAQEIESSLSRLRQRGALARMPYYQGLLAETLLSAGYATRAGAILQAALARAAVYGDVWYVAELWRLEARRHTGDVARGYLHKAVALADSQQSLVLRRRVITDLSEIAKVKNGVRTP
jgi:predicted ATPase